MARSFVAASIGAMRLLTIALAGVLVACSATGVGPAGVDGTDQPSAATAAVFGQVRVPLGERGFELVGIVSALGEPDGSGVGGDAVLVPGDLPGNRHDDVGVDA